MKETIIIVIADNIKNIFLVIIPEQSKKMLIISSIKKPKNFGLFFFMIYLQKQKLPM